MKWKLWTRNESNRSADDGFEEYDSDDAALEGAFGIIQHQRHVVVLYIEGPAGERFEAADIAAWCKMHGRPA